MIEERKVNFSKKTKWMMALGGAAIIIAVAILLTRD